MKINKSIKNLAFFISVKHKAFLIFQIPQFTIVNEDFKIIKNNAVICIYEKCQKFVNYLL